MAQPQITFYVDIVSPFAYIGYYLLRHDPVFAQCDVRFVPVLLGGIMKECDNTPPLNIKNKDRWINQERSRWASLFNVPIADTVPPGFPPRTLLLMRVLSSWSLVSPSPDSWLKVLDVIYHAFWVEHQPIQEADALKDILRTILPENDVLKLFDLANKEGKELLIKTTKEAFNDGAFGLPWFMCKNTKGETESFWGIDHLGQVCLFMGIDKPNTRGWKAML